MNKLESPDPNNDPCHWY